MVGTPLMELEESWMFGMFPTRLLIFDDRIEVRDFELMRERTTSKGYDRVDGATVSGEGWLANIVIALKDEKPILIRGISRDDAGRAGALIEDRAARAGDLSAPETPTVDVGRLIQNLAELRDAGILSEEEFETKFREMTVRKEPPP